MKISNLPESPGRDLLMRLEYLDYQPGGDSLHEQYHLASDASGYYLVLLANYIAGKCGDTNSGFSIEQINEFFSRKRDELTKTN